MIPIKSFQTGNLRLADALDNQQRARLGYALASHVAETVDSTGLLAMIVTADPEVAAWATSIGFATVPDSGQGLNAAASMAADWAAAGNSRWLLLHADLPLLSRGDVEALNDAMQPGNDVISPSSDGGTSALSASTPIEFAFGPGSFHTHLPRLEDPVVVARTGLFHDIDSPVDLNSAMRHPRGEWLRGVIG